jgi:HEAT repeat protein
MPEINRDWRRRGYISKEVLVNYIDYTDIDIFMLLESDEASNRTIAASVLGNRKDEFAVNLLIKALIKEKALYSKIAISEALGNLGELAANDLILLFGKIGNNQYKTIPTKTFKKWNYPLPRDIAARTITKIGINALNPILNSIGIMNKSALSEAIDALGYISFYNKNQSALPELLKLLEVFKTDDLITWKIIRSLQSFPLPETIKILEDFMDYHIQTSIRNEAARSIAQICKKPANELLSSIDKNEIALKMSFWKSKVY